MFPVPRTKFGKTKRIDLGLREILAAHREMVAPTIPYTRLESERASKEVGQRLRWFSKYLLRGGGVFQPKFRQRMTEEAEGFAGFGPAYMPLAGKAAVSAAMIKGGTAAGRAAINKAKMISLRRAIRAAETGGSESTPANLSKFATNRLLTRIAVQQGTKDMSPATLRSFADLLGQEVPKTVAGKKVMGGVIWERIARGVAETPRFLEK